MEVNNLYIDLLKRSINNYLYLGGNRDFDQHEVGAFYSFEKQEWNLPESSKPHSLLNVHKLNALQLLMYDVIMNKVPGDFIEAGVYQGGTIIFMLGFLKALGIDDRLVWAADSFEGIPQPERFAHIDDPVNQWVDRWDAGLDLVKSNIARYDLAGPNLRFIEGYFADALPGAPLDKIALARLDADAYESTIDALDHIYPKISEGGYVIIDDWHLPGCQQACVDFRKEHNIDDPVSLVYGTGAENQVVEAFWRVDTKYT